MTDYTDLLYEVSGGVATITLNRPDRLNAITGPMLDSLSKVLRDSDVDREVRVIVITGAGRGNPALNSAGPVAAGSKPAPAFIVVIVPLLLLAIRCPGGSG